MRVRARMILPVILSAVSTACGGEDPISPDDTNGLLAHFTFEGNANDVSGSGNHGTLRGGASATGTLALGYNVADMLSVPSAVMDGLGDFTVSAWLKINVFRDEEHMFFSGANAIEDNMIGAYYRDYADEWVFMIDSDFLPFATDASIEDGQWHHVAVTRTGANAALYLNGVQMGPAIAVLDDVLEIDPNGLVFGQDQDSVAGGFEIDEAWAGEMDNLRIYERALSPAEIQTLSVEAHS